MHTNGITQYHACYYAHELTRRCPSNSLQKLAATLADAQVDLNPHQIDAPLFAFRSPLSKGAILADEVFEARDAVDTRKDGLLSEIETRLKQGVAKKELFAILWSIK